LGFRRAIYNDRIAAAIRAEDRIVPNILAAILTIPLFHNRSSPSILAGVDVVVTLQEFIQQYFQMSVGVQCVSVHIDPSLNRID
jgi:hypothetical protein